MTLDDHFRDQISRGQPPLIALHNAAHAYAESLKPRDCSQYADETAAWSESQDSEAVDLLREGDTLMKIRQFKTMPEIHWHERVRKFLEGKE